MQFCASIFPQRAARKFSFRKGSKIPGRAAQPNQNQHMGWQGWPVEGTDPQGFPLRNHLGSRNRSHHHQPPGYPSVLLPIAHRSSYQILPNFAACFLQNYATHCFPELLTTNTLANCLLSPWPLSLGYSHPHDITWSWNPKSSKRAPDEGSY